MDVADELQKVGVRTHPEGALRGLEDGGAEGREERDALGEVVVRGHVGARAERRLAVPVQAHAPAAHDFGDAPNPEARVVGRRRRRVKARVLARQ